MLREENPEEEAATLSSQGGMPPAPSTRVEWAAEKLRDAILTGELQPGEKVPVAALCESWQVSATPMREAIARLATEGLLEATPQRGARVAPMSWLEARELYELRLQLEPELLRRSLERFEDADRAAVAEAYEEYRRQWSTGSPVVYAMHHAHNEFHEATYRRCESPWLLNIVINLTTHSMRYSGAAYSPDQRLELHGVLNDAIQAADVDAAVAALGNHTRPGLDWVTTQLAEEEDDRG
jgi:DNA-binding GntR family transcriptional regulator